MKNDTTKDCIASPQRVGASGFMITEVEKELEVTLLPNDKLRININQHSDGKKLNILSVEEFYNKAIIGESISLDGYSDFEKLDLLNIGDSRDSFAVYQNAVEFTDKIIVNYTIGGV